MSNCCRKQEIHPCRYIKESIIERTENKQVDYEKRRYNRINSTKIETKLKFSFILKTRSPEYWIEEQACCAFSGNKIYFLS